LLSDFASPMSPGWERLDGHGGPAPAAFAMFSNQSRGPFGGPALGSWAERQPFRGIGSPPSAAAFISDPAPPSLSF
jgi:hypothetical protein